MLPPAVLFLLLPFSAAAEVSLLPAEGEAARYWPRWRRPNDRLSGARRRPRVLPHRERASRDRALTGWSIRARLWYRLR